MASRMSSVKKLEWWWTFARIVLLYGVAAVACASSPDRKTYPIIFVCADPGLPGCPGKQPCPSIPLGAGGCEDLPGLYGHAPIKVETGRPFGCGVGLPYGDVLYGDSQAKCLCLPGSSTAQPDKLAWGCGM